ncbi:MAG TPA: response regulator [Candidatus Cybelea sp.]|nr:response regulator [Candidatus Cybelea sp.]
MESSKLWSRQKNNRILVIDDNPEIHQDFRKVLGAKIDPGASALDSAEAAIFGGESEPAPDNGFPGEEFQIDSAYQGQEGLEMVQRALEEGRPYAMAFVDVRMPPGWDGIETIVQIWRKYPELQVVICTAYSDYSWKEITQKLGASDSLVVLKKPFDNIEAMQLAHALTKKWLVTRQANARMADLDAMVRQRTEDLEAANERFSKAFRASPLPMAICQVNATRFLDVNESFSRLFGLQHGAIIGRSDNELNIWAHADDQAMFWQLVHSSGRVREMKCRLRTPAGAIHDALAFGEELLLNQERCALMVFYDMSHQLKLEAQLRHSQKMEAIGQLASGVAHDFNNLLTVIRGHAELRIGTVDLDEELSESLKQIARATERAACLTRQLLTFGRRHMTQPRPINLNDLVTSLGEMAQSLISEQIQFDCHLTERLKPAHADPSSLEQVLLNLIVNARDAMPQGGRLTISTAACEIGEDEARLNSEARAGSFICLSVQDTGCGMDTQTLNRVFEPFFTTKPIGKGTGMGLAMVYGIVKQHQGWISVSSRPGQGTHFRIFLPVSNEPVAPPAGDAEDVQAQRGHETILLVEDEAALRNVIGNVLTAAGYRVLPAVSGVDALRIWFSEDEKIDLLFSDVVMPEGMTGRKLAEKLRARKPGLKVVLTSGHDTELKYQDSSVPDALFVAKPFSPAEIISTVRACLDKRADVAEICAGQGN